MFSYSSTLASANAGYYPTRSFTTLNYTSHEASAQTSFSDTDGSTGLGGSSNYFSVQQNSVVTNYIEDTAGEQTRHTGFSNDNFTQNTGGDSGSAAGASFAYAYTTFFSAEIVGSAINDTLLLEDGLYVESYITNYSSLRTTASSSASGDLGTTTYFVSYNRNDLLFTSVALYIKEFFLGAQS